MLRWRLSRIAILSLGSVASALTWADPPLCPSAASSNDQRSAASGATGAQSAPPADNPPAPRDAGTQSPKIEIGAGAIDITSDEATVDAEGKATLHGNVSIHQGDREIRAEQLEYNSQTNGMRTDGGIEYQDPVVHLTGEGGRYSPTEGADFRSAHFDLRQRAARGSADSLKLSPKGVIDLQGVRFTTCPMSEEAWKMRAAQVTLDTGNRVGVARSARVDFEGVPILYLPWLSFPLDNERKSGFLFPTVGNSSRSGAELSVPYYWNIAPNADATFEPILYSRRGADLSGDLRYLTTNQHGELDWNYLPYDNVAGQSRSRVKLTNVTELPDHFRLSIDAENVSDTTYFEDFAQGPEGTSTAFVEQRALLTYRDEHWKIDGEAQHFQTIDNTLAEIDRPYARVPRLAVNADYGWGPAQQLQYGFESEVVYFDRALGITGWRADLLPEASLNFAGPGYFVRPGLAWRATQYELGRTTAGEERTPSRTMPIASFDTGLVFERFSGALDQRRLTLEPRVLYLYVPYRNQDQLPLFDTALPDLDPVELFRNNRYVGADRVSDANQLSVGVTSRLLDSHDGRQFLSATLGQIHYFQNPRVVLPDEVPRTDGRSDFVAQIALTAFRHWSAGLGLQWNPQTSRSERSQLNVQYKASGDAVVNLGYRYQRGVLEQAELSSAWPVSAAWNIFVRGVYSIQDHKPLERFAGFEYRACCWRVRLGGRTFVSTHTGSQDTGVYLQLELAGLASVGSASDSFLTEAIRGYDPAADATPKLKAR